MKVVSRLFLGTVLVVLIAAGAITAYVLPITTTEIDPNLGKPQCPGGKDWYQPGSSCHNGIIVDYVYRSSERDLEVPMKVGRHKKKRGC
jgi:hypothetical protein